MPGAIYCMPADELYDHTDPEWQPEISWGWVTDRWYSSRPCEDVDGRTFRQVFT